MELELIIVDYFRVIYMPAQASVSPINSELIAFLGNLNARKVIFTNGYVDTETFEKFLKTTFDQVYTTRQLGLEKIDSHSYLKICQTESTDRKRTLFVDDQEKNVLTASQAGLKSIQYQDNKQIFEALKIYE